MKHSYIWGFHLLVDNEPRQDLNAQKVTRSDKRSLNSGYTDTCTCISINFPMGLGLLT